MKVYFKRFICLLLVVCLTLGGVWYIDRVLRLKRVDGILTMQNFYAQPKESVDVLFIGNSHSGINIDTATLWNNYGISSYNLWGGVQPLWNSYYFLIEALKYQRPEVVVLEITAASSDYEYSEEQNQLKNTAGMKLSKTKLEAVKVSAPKDRWLDLFLGLPLYHGRFDEVEQKDFENFPWSDGLENFKGSYLLYGVGNYRFESAEGVNKNQEIMEKEREYLIKIIKLCEEEKLPLMLLKTPALERHDAQKIYKTVAEIADVHSLPFINMNLMDNELGITENDWSLDRHMNGEGARKVADWLGKYLTENYDLTDHRGDTAYDSWFINARTVNNDYLAAITDAENFFTELDKDGNTVLLIKNSPWEGNEEYLALCGMLEKTGMDIKTLDENEHGAWLISDTVSALDHDGDIYSTELDGKALEVNFEYLTANLGGKELAWFGTSDILCVVYDEYLHNLVDIISFSQSGHYRLERAEK